MSGADPARPEPRELLISGGTVLLPEGPRADGALLLRGDTIVAAGGRSEIDALAARDAERIDAGGGTILPGFIDAHAHPISTGLSLRPGLSVRYPGVSSLEELVRAVAELVAGAPAGEWVRGRGFDHGKYPEARMPTRWDIDPVSPRHPVALIHASGHFALVNSQALERAGITEATPDPPGGEYVRDAGGRPTGMLLDGAMETVLPSVGLVGSHGPSHNNFPAPREELGAQLGEGLRAFAAAGVTTVVDAQMMARDLPVYLEARERGELPIRVIGMFLSNHLDALEALGLNRPLGDDRFALGPLKLYCDGSLSGCTALFHGGHVGHGGHGEYGEHGDGTEGRAFWSADELDELVLRAHRFGLQVGIHAQGDAAIARSLDAIEAALRALPRPDHRHRIEHCGAPSQADIARIAALGVIPVAQPAFLTQFGDNLAAQLGERRAARVHPLADYLRAGIPVAFSSDSPVSSHRPLDAIQAAVHRRRTSGPALGPEQEIGLADAIRAHTRDAARSVFREHRYGELRPGLAADVILTDRDLFAIPHDEISACRVTRSFVAGSELELAP